MRKGDNHYLDAEVIVKSCCFLLLTAKVNAYQKLLMREYSIIIVGAINKVDDLQENDGNEVPKCGSLRTLTNEMLNISPKVEQQQQVVADCLCSLVMVMT